MAYSGLADAYTLLDEYTLLGRFRVDSPRPKDVMPKALAAAERAVQIDETLAEAHASLVFIKSKQWDWSGAQQEAKRAIELNPGYPTAYDWYAVRYLMLLGRLDEALAATQKALNLDPLSIVTNKHLGWHYYYAHRYDEAIKQYQKTLAIESKYAQAIADLGKAYEQKGMFDEALAEIEKAITFSGESPTLIAARGYTYAVSGKTVQAQKIVEQLEEESRRNYIPPYLIAEVYIGLGKNDQAFHWLEKAFEERSPILLYSGIEPRLDKVRSDPRFTVLLKRLGLKP